MKICIVFILAERKKLIAMKKLLRGYTLTKAFSRNASYFMFIYFTYKNRSNRIQLFVDCICLN